jgi:hypothetical protein
MTAKAAGLAFTLVLASTVPSLAEEPGRYSMIPAGEGFLRLDTESGAVSLCSRKSIGWACESLPDDAAPARLDNDHLSQETGEPRDRLAKAESDLAAAKAQNAELAARAEAAEKAEKDAKAEEAERVAKAEEAAKNANPDSHAVQPHAPESLVPERAVDEFSEFITKLIRRLQEMARDLQRDQSERAL